MARRALHRPAQARRHARRGSGGDGGIEPAHHGATAEAAAFGDGDALARGSDREDLHVAAHAARGVGRHPAHCLRQPGQLADGAWSCSPPRSRGASGARRWTRPPARAVPGREPGARRAGRDRRARARRSFHAVSGNAGARDHGCRAAVARLARAGVLHNHHCRRGIDVRPGARVRTARAWPCRPACAIADAVPPAAAATACSIRSSSSKPPWRSSCSRPEACCCRRFSICAS